MMSLQEPTNACVVDNSLGVWTAFPSVLGGLDGVLARATEIGADWIAPQIMTGQWSTEDTERAITAGFGVRPWVYSHPETMLREVVAFEAHFLVGAEMLIIDAETPWSKPGAEAPLTQKAEEYGQRIFDSMGEIMCADAPWPYRSFHPTYPYEGFSWCKRRYVQSYWSEIGRPYAEVMQRTAVEWKGHEYHPIGVSYGKAELVALGTKNPTAIAFNPDDLIAYLSGSTNGKSIYSIEAMSKTTLEKVKKWKSGKSQET